MNLRKEIIGGVISFVEAGTQVSDGSGGQEAVSATVKPAAASGAWYSLGKVIDLNFDKAEDSDTVTYFDPATSSYEQEEEKVVLADFLDFKVREHSEHIYRMLFGVAGALPTDGATAVSPFSANNREIRGWVQVHGRSAKDGANRVVMDLWVAMSLKAYPGWTPKTTIPELRMRKQSSALNTMLPMADI